VTGRKDCNYKSLVSSEVCGSAQATLEHRRKSQGVKPCFPRSTTKRCPDTSQYLKFFYKETRDKIYQFPQLRTTMPNTILCTVPSKALLLMNLQTLQSTNPPSTPFTLNPSPIPTNLTEMPDGFHPILIHPRSPRLVVSHWRHSQKFLNLLL
jgi:hypothetical protein